MSVKITSVMCGSPAAKKGIKSGDILISVNGYEINDILDYRFRITETKLELLIDRDGEKLNIALKKPMYDDIGLEFATFLMDEKKSCRNKCVFCFIDQNPPGMRETIYFKDDDTRLSFLMGNYVTLTNVDFNELSRLVEMKISPINISVHTTSPELRVKMLGNRFAGDILEKMSFLAKSESVKMNCQIVVCRSLNDGEELEKTIKDLAGFYPHVESIAVVPSGLTKWRDGLYPLEPFDKESAGNVIDITEKLGEELLCEKGTRLVYASDEFYILAERTLPDEEFYEEFSQLDNGVGLIRSDEADIRAELDFTYEDEMPKNRRYMLITGKAAESFMKETAEKIHKKFPGIIIDVVGAENKFFGDTVTVAGLLTGTDFLAAAKENEEILNKADAVIIPAVSLRSERDLFLDGNSPKWLSEQIGKPVITAENGAGIIEALK